MNNFVIHTYLYILEEIYVYIYIFVFNNNLTIVILGNQNK